MQPFRAFGDDHLAALAAITLVAVAVALWVRTDREGRAWVRYVVAAGLLGAGLGFVVVEALAGMPWRGWAPLQLCDVAVPIGVVALATRRQLAFELTYFWGGAGTTLALLTPDLAEGFPHHRFLLYFAQHGGIVVAAVLLSLGLGMRPRPRAPWIALAWLNGYAALLFAFNVAFDANFMYLRHKPGVATPLDMLGPWPFYILGSELVALGLFWLLMLPWARQPARKSP